MDNFKGENPESPEDILQKIPVLSSYAKGLENHIKERYLKISVVGVDPAALPNRILWNKIAGHTAPGQCGVQKSRGLATWVAQLDSPGTSLKVGGWVGQAWGAKLVG